MPTIDRHETDRRQIPIRNDKIVSASVSAANSLNCVSFDENRISNIANIAFLGKGSDTLSSGGIVSLLRLTFRVQIEMLLLLLVSVNFSFFSLSFGKTDVKLSILTFVENENLIRVRRRSKKSSERDFESSLDVKLGPEKIRKISSADLEMGRKNAGLGLISVSPHKSHFPRFSGLASNSLT